MSTLSSGHVVPSNERAGQRQVLDYLVLVVKGFCMGCADVVPGVSGGTMAFILGIYEELLRTIRNVGRRPFIQALLRVQFTDLLRILNWKFLLSVLVGIVLALVTLAPGLEWLLENRPVYLWSFFFGLVLASVLTVSQRVPSWSPLLFGFTLVGTIVAYIIVGLSPTQTPETWWFLMLSGAIAICAMILPGVSGSFMLVLLGKYQFFLSAVNNRDVVSIALAGIGAVIGLVSFAQLLSWLFKHYHDATVALLTGLMIGSLRKVWPWKEVLETIIDRHGIEIPVVEQNILPPLSLNGQFNTEIFYAAGLAILGFLLVMVIERVGNSSE